MSAQSDDERSQANESATRAALPDLWIGRVLQRAGLVPEEQLKLAVAQQEGAHTRWQSAWLPWASWTKSRCTQRSASMWASAS